MLCSEGQIDPTFFTDVDGHNYVIWKEDGNAFNPPHPTPIKLQLADSSGLNLVGNYTVILKVCRVVYWD